MRKITLAIGAVIAAIALAGAGFMSLSGDGKDDSPAACAARSAQPSTQASATPNTAADTGTKDDSAQCGDESEHVDKPGESKN